MIRVSVALLEKQNVELKGEEPPEFLEIQDGGVYRLESPVRYKLLAQRVSGGALVTGSVETEITGECGRCLTPTNRTVRNSDIHLFYEIEGEPELDLSEDVRAEMVVELPINLLCSDECAGLCSGCGANLNQEKCRCKAHPEADDSDADAWGALDRLRL